MRALLLLPLVAGCGSYWDVRDGVELNLGCASLLNYYPDADGDGWGEAGAAPTPLCAPDPANGLTAANDRDCDDADLNIGARLSQCPQDLVEPGEPASLVGLVRGGVDYVAVLTDESLFRHADAEKRCEFWGGASTDEAPPGHRGLAVLADGAELTELLNTIDESIGATSETVTLFIGAGWDDSAQAWVWLDGSEQRVAGSLPFCCNVEPDVMDFVPTLVKEDLLTDDPDDPDRQAKAEAYERLVEQSRLAIIKNGSPTSGAGWCLGVPAVQPGVNGTCGTVDFNVGDATEFAHFVCERPTPDPAVYVSIPVNED